MLKIRQNKDACSKYVLFVEISTTKFFKTRTFKKRNKSYK